MFINGAIQRFQNSSLGEFFADSFIFKNIDNISFLLLVLTIISTSFAESWLIGFLAILFSLSVVFKLFVEKGERIEISLLNKVFIVYLLIVIISALGASYFVLSLKGLMKTIIYAWFYFSAVNFLSSNRKKIIPIIILISLTSGMEAIIGIIQNLSHIEAIATWQDTSNVVDPTKVISRAYGTLKPYNPNLLAGYLLVGLSSAFGMGLISNYKKNKPAVLFSLGLFGLIFFAILATGSRGAYLGLLGFLSVIFISVLTFAKKRYGNFSKIKTKFKLIFGSFIVFCFGILCFIPSFSQRLLSVFSFRKDSSISFRMNVYEACVQMFSDNPFLGIGVGNKNFREIYGLYMKTGYDALGAYCVPLEIAVESGIFALLAFVFFIALICIRSVKCLIANGIHPIKKAIIFSILLSIIAVMFHGLFDTIFFRPQVQILFWINIAIFHSLTIKKSLTNK